MEIDLEVAQIMARNLAVMVGMPMLAIVETPAGYEVHQHHVDGVAPQTIYATKREAASRVLQLLGIGPVAPQTWPETTCIGEASLAKSGDAK